MVRTALAVACVLAAGLCGPALAQEYQPNLAQIGVTPTLHQSVDGGGVLVGILDGYADYDLNPDLVRAGNGVSVIYPGTYGFYSLHATHVSGIVAAAADGSGVVGVAPGASLLSLPVFDDKGWVATDLGKAALNAAVAHGASIVNMSYGPTKRGDVFLNGELALFDDYLDSLLIVRAAGNSGTKALNEYYAGVASADLANLLIVGSVDANNKISSFSTRPGSACIATKSTCAASEKVSNFFIVAPGRSIVSDVPGGGTMALSGTSMAAPHVAGAAALVFADALDKNLVLTPAEVAAILKRSAKDLGTAGVDSVYGWGLLDVPGALSPVGTTFVATGPTVADGGTPVKKGRMRISAAFARGGVDLAFAGSVYFDEYGRPFDASGLPVAADPTATARSLAVLAATTAGATGFAEGLSFTAAGGAELGGGVNAFVQADDRTRTLLGFGEPRSYFSGATSLGPLSGGSRLATQFLGGAGGVAGAFDRSMFGAYDRVLNDRISVSGVAFSGLGDNLDLTGAGSSWDSPTAGFAAAGVTYRASDRISVTGGFGFMAENGSVLGSASEGPYGLADAALTQVASLTVGYALDQRRTVSLYADGALTDPLGTGGALVGTTGPLTAARVGIGFNATDVLASGDRLSLLFGRPFAVISGQSTITVATGRQLDGTVDYETRVVDYGAGLPLEAGLAYQAGSSNFRYGLEARLVGDDVTSGKRHVSAFLNAALRLGF